MVGGGWWVVGGGWVVVVGGGGAPVQRCNESEARCHHKRQCGKSGGV